MKIVRFHILLGCVLICCGLSLPLSAQDARPSNTPYAAQRSEWDGTYRAIRVPILMYHYVSDPPELADDVRVNLSVSPEDFREHMDYLFYAGYTTISLYQLYDALMRGSMLPPKPIILTFDDGYIDHYINVYPTLRDYGFTGTFFIITAPIDRGNEGYVSWQQVAEMAAGGMSMESHTRDHMELVGRDYDFLVYQLLGAQETLAAHTNRIPHMFAYPVGRYDDTTLAVLETTSTWLALTTANGDTHYSDALLELPRIRVSNATTVEVLSRMLSFSE